MYKIKRFSTIKPVINNLAKLSSKVKGGITMPNIGINKSLLMRETAETKAKELMKSGVIGGKTPKVGPNTMITSNKSGVDRSLWKNNYSNSRKEMSKANNFYNKGDYPNLSSRIINEQNNLPKSSFQDLDRMSNLNKKVPGDTEKNKNLIKGVYRNDNRGNSVAIDVFKSNYQK